MITSKDARRVLEHLYGYGVPIDLADLHDIELCCAAYHVNHITGVIDRCLGSKDPATSLMKAQDQGWGYFRQPMRSMLRGRKSAHRQPGVTVPPVPPDTWVIEAYSIVIRTLLLTDMDRREADLVIWQIPELCDRESLTEAIRVCKQNNVRTGHYLHAVLKRSSDTREGRKREIIRDREGAEPFQPTTTEPADAERASRRWEDRLNDIKIVKALNAEDS